MQWTIEDVGNWLYLNNLDDYIGCFANNGITGYINIFFHKYIYFIRNPVFSTLFQLFYRKQLLELEEKEFDTLNIRRLGDRKLLKQNLEKIGHKSFSRTEISSASSTGSYSEPSFGDDDDDSASSTSDSSHGECKYSFLYF